MKTRLRGLTMIEVLLAIAVLAIALAAIAMTTTSGLRQNAIAGGRTQAAQVLNYLGRRVAGGEAAQLQPLQWNYGELAGTFEEMSNDGNLSNPELYKAEIRMLETLGIGASTMVHYQIEVCWEQGDSENCLVGDTAGPALTGSTGDSLPGIN